MPNFNSLVLAGHLGQDPQVETVGENNTIKVTFSVAVKVGWGENETTSWNRCIMWGKRGQAFAEYHQKGDPVLIRGQQVNRQYEKDGETKYISEVWADEFSFLKSKSGDSGGGEELPY